MTMYYYNNSHICIVPRAKASEALEESGGIKAAVEKTQVHSITQQSVYRQTVPGDRQQHETKDLKT